jgi:hypothetical protein
LTPPRAINFFFTVTYKGAMEKVAIFFLLALFGCLIAYECFRHADAKAHAQPSRFMILAIIAVLIAFFTNLAAEAITKRTPESLQSAVQFWPLLASMTNLMCGAFAGALASAAITNRAKFMHDKKVEELPGALANRMKLLRRATRDLQLELDKPLPGDPYDAIQLQKKKNSLQQIIERQFEEIDKIDTELEALGIAKPARSA